MLIIEKIMIMIMNMFIMPLGPTGNAEVRYHDYHNNCW